VTHETRRQQSGFTLIELLIVVIIIGILAAIATGAYARQRGQAKASACRADMAQVENAERSHILENGSASANLQTLVSDQLLERVPTCPAGGLYSWKSDVDGNVKLFCSVHGFVDGQGVSATASFASMTANLIALELAYYAEHGSWPRSWAPYCYTDLGLDPAQFSGPQDNVIYTVGGSKVNARPAPGYVMTVIDAQGDTRVMTNSLNWSLTYDATSGQWYYHTISPANLIDISTLKTTPA